MRASYAGPTASEAMKGSRYKILAGQSAVERDSGVSTEKGPGSPPQASATGQQQLTARPSVDAEEPEGNKPTGPLPGSLVVDTHTGDKGWMPARTDNSQRLTGSESDGVWRATPTQYIGRLP